MPGPGRSRGWDPVTVALVARMGRLVHAGLAVEVAARVAHRPGELQTVAPGVYVLITAGGS